MDQLVKRISNLGSLECGLLVKKKNKNLDKFTWAFEVTCNIFIFASQSVKTGSQRRKKRNLYLCILTDQLETSHDIYFVRHKLW